MGLWVSLGKFCYCIVRLCWLCSCLVSFGKVCGGMVVCVVSMVWVCVLFVFVGMCLCCFVFFVISYSWVFGVFGKFCFFCRIILFCYYSEGLVVIQWLNRLGWVNKVCSMNRLLQEWFYRFSCVVFSVICWCIWGRR